MKKDNIEHYRLIYRVIVESIENISRKKSREFNVDFDDLCQVGWIEYFEFLEKFKHESINRIRFKIMKAVRKETDIRENIDASVCTNKLNNIPGNDYSYGERVTLILNELSDRDRKIMEIYFVRSYTQDEISKKLNIPQQTLSDIISRSLQKLKS